MFSLTGTSCTGFSVISNTRQPLPSTHLLQQQQRTSRVSLTYRLSICASSAQATISPSPISPGPSVHPDALRRRAQALAWCVRAQGSFGTCGADVAFIPLDIGYFADYVGCLLSQATKAATRARIYSTRDQVVSSSVMRRRGVDPDLLSALFLCAFKGVLELWA